MPTGFSRPAAVVAAWVLTLAVGIGSANGYDCEAQVDEALQQQGVSQSDVDSVKLARRSRSAKSSNNYRYDAWVRLKSCSNGAVVVSLTKYCMVEQVYTRGDCQIGGIPSY